MPFRRSLQVALAAAIGVACGSTALPVDPATPCGATMTLCRSRCVDLRHDPANCGSCGIGCAADETCVEGTCRVGCFGGATSCGNACVRLEYDPANCGSCGNACESGVACLNGGCANGCGSKQTACGTTCTNVSSDAANCGSCGTSCGLGAVCTNGVCECKGTFCGGQCTDLQIDPTHCGSCEVACAKGSEVCSAGKCMCAKGRTLCGGTCVDTNASAKNCGGCGNACPAGQLCDLGSCINPTSEFTTQGANPARDGVVAGETGRPPLTLSWSVEAPNDLKVQPIVIGKSYAFVTFANTYFPASELRALDLSDGTSRWTSNLGGILATGLPSYANGRVYLANGHGFNGPPPRVLAFDAVTGDLVWITDVDDSESYWSPLVVGNTLYTNAATFGGLAGYDVTQGSKLFEVAFDQAQRWAAAWSGSEVLAFVAGRLRGQNPTTGAVNWATLVSTKWAYGSGTFPVVSSGRAFVIAPTNLYALDLSTHSVVWTGYGSYEGMAAVLGDSVFAVSSGNLVVRSAATGAFQWSFAGDGALENTPVIANGFVYVSSAKNVYAVDLTTHQQAWTAADGGSLAIGSRRLLVASPNAIHAYRMSN